MELLYAVVMAIALALLWRGVQWFRDYRRRLRIRLEPVPPGPEEPSFPELGQVRVRPRGETAPPAGEPRLGAAGTTHRTGSPRPIVVPVPEEDSVPVLLTPAVSAPVPEVQQQDMFADEMIAPPPRRERERPPPLDPSPRVEPVQPVRAEHTQQRPHVDVQEVIALHVVAREHPFNGEDLLRCILSYGLRYGEMSIFHRHEQPTGQGRILFSMAKAVEPGTFDLEAMTGEEIPGVSFFLSLPGVNSIHAYDIMVDTAKRLATELQGDILDEQQQPLTRQLIEHYRERVQEFERRRLMQRPAN